MNCEQRRRCAPDGLSEADILALAAEGLTFEETEMDGTKPWYMSNAVWASMMTMVTGLLVTFGMMTSEMAVAIVGEVPGYMVGLMTALVGLWGLWGRWTAVKKVS